MLAVTVVFFLPTLILIRAYIFADSATYYYPARTFMSSGLKHGQLPLMCRYIYCGYPLFADSESSLFYPVNVLAAFFPDIFAFNYSLFAHYLACALFTYLYARVIRLSKTSSVFAALAFTFFGFTIAHMGHTNIVNSVAWFPLILYLVEKGMRDDSFSWFLWAGVALGVQFLSGFLFMSLVTVAVVFFYAVLYPRDARWTWRGLGRAAGMFAVFAVLGAGLGMIQNLPSYELVGVSTRAGGLSSALYNYNNLPPVQLITFIFPRYFGGPTGYWGSWGFVETYGYVGLLPLVLLPAAFMRKRTWHTWFFATAGLLALIISFGNVGLLYRLVRLVPGFNVLKDPARFLVLVDFAVIILAAIGLDRLLDRVELGERSTKRLVWLVTGVAAAAVGGLVLAKLIARWGVIDFFTFKNFQIRSWAFYGPVILLALLLALLWLWRYGFFTRGLFAGLLLAFVILEVFAVSYGINPRIETGAIRAEPGFVEAIKTDGGDAYRVALSKDPAGSIALYNWQPNMLMPFGLQDARGYSAVEPGRMTEFIKLADRNPAMFSVLNVAHFIANLTPVDGRRFDTNLPGSITVESGGLSWFLAGDFAPDGVEMLTTLKGVRPATGTVVAELLGLTASGEVIGPFPIRAGEETGPAGGGAGRRVEYDRTGTAKPGVAYLGEIGFGRRVADLQVLGIRSLDSLGDGELAITAINMVGDGFRAVEPGPVIYQDAGYVVYRNPGVYPRAYVAGGVRLAESASASMRALLDRENFSPQNTIALESSTLPDSLRRKVEGWSEQRVIRGQATPLSVGEGTEAYQVEAMEEGVLLWSQEYMPGWSASIDGKPTGIYPAFGALQAVYIPEGQHTVEFSYSAPGLLPGMLITILALIAGAAAILLLWRRRRRAAPSIEPDLSPSIEPGLSGREDTPAQTAQEQPPGPDPLAGGLSVFFPAYNDEGTIEGLVETAAEAAGRHTKDLEIIIIDDGSTDGTGETADRLSAGDDRVCVIHHEENRGYGGALKSGLEAASKGLVFYTDGDGQYDPAELELLLERRFEADVVNGYKVGRADPVYRRVLGRLYGGTVRLLFGIAIRDVDCDFRLMRKSALEGLALEADSGAICLEMVKKMQDRGVTFAEVPVGHFPRRSGRSQFFNARNLFRTTVELMGQYWKLEVRRNVLGDRLN
ncbi:MAG: glycosyltransferase [Actinomycetota bacterium]